MFFIENTKKKNENIKIRSGVSSCLNFDKLNKRKNNAFKLKKKTHWHYTVNVVFLS